MDCRIREYGSEYDWRANDDFLFPNEQHQSPFSGAQAYRSGRDALKAVALACRGDYDRVLLPALCCESMVTPFIMHGIALAFYRVNPDYTADISDIENKMNDDTILLYQSYFGIPPFEKEKLIQLRQKFSKAMFVEDRTQDLLLPREDSFLPDVTVASVRKWTAIADGGLLWSRSLFCSDAGQADAFAQLRRSAMEKKTAYLNTGETALKDSYRKMLGQASDLLDMTSKPYAMTAESVQLLERLDIGKILARRQRNAKCLQELLQDTVERGQLQWITDQPERSTLYFPILVQDQERFQRELAQQNIYCPVIWPVPKQAQGICSVAEYTAAHVLGVPCDHRYSETDMEYIARQIVRLCNEQ